MSYFELRKRSPIESFRNFIPCGVHSCKFSCVENSVQCEICLKYFHYKCKNLTQKRYKNIIEKKVSYICSDMCLISFLPFSGLDRIDIVNTCFGGGKNPCKKCKRECLMTGKLMECDQCAGCKLYFHLNCTKAEYQKAIKLDKNSTYEFTCSVKCAKLSKQLINKHFPFYGIGDNVFENFHIPDNYPCKKCCKECIDYCIQCDECEKWLHYECAELSQEEFFLLSNLKYRDFYCIRCMMRQHPFYLNTVDDDDAVIDGGPATTSSDVASSGGIGSTSMNDSTPPSNSNDNSSRKARKHKKVKTSNETVYFDQFLEVKCSNLCPKDLNDS